MDTWTRRQLTAMKAGGNHGLKQFLKEQDFPSDLLLELKYSSRAFDLYRERIKALTEGRTPSSIPKLGFTEEDKTRWSEPKAAEPKASASGNMRAMGSEPQGAGGVKVDDVLASLSGGFWSAAGATTNLASNAANIVAKKSTEAASLVSKKGTEAASSIASSTSKLAQSDLTSTLKTSAASGWSGFSSWIGQAAQTTISLTADAANSLTEAVVGGEEAPKLYQRPESQSTRKFEGFGGDAVECPNPSVPPSVSKPGVPKAAGKKNDSWGLDDYQPELNGEKFDGARRENSKRPDQITRPDGLRRTGSNPTEAARGGFAGFEEEERPAEIKFHMNSAQQETEPIRVVAKSSAAATPAAVTPALEAKKPAAAKQDGWDDDFFKDF